VEQLRSRLTYANVVSSLCLFLLLGGGAAVAAGGLGPNTVGPAQLKKNAVTTAKIKNGAVTGSKIKVSTLPTVPFAGNAAIALSAKSAVHAFSADEAAKAGTAATATRATEASHATSAESAADSARLGGSLPSAFAPASSVVRYASVSDSGTLIKGQGITQANVTKNPGAAIYCINGLEPAPVAAISQLGYGGLELPAYAFAEVDYAGCQVQIATYGKTGGSATQPFTVLLR
jgi:hypothetical protein